MRSGLVVGLLSFLSNLAMGIIFPICAPLCGLIWGAAAGVLSVVWSEPEKGGQSPAQQGATAGAIAGIGGILGLVIGGVLNYTVLGGQEASIELSRQFGLPADPNDPAYATGQWLGVLGMSCCVGLLNLGVQAGAGAAGAHLYAGRR
jgi:hypothetical protein